MLRLFFVDHILHRSYQHRQHFPWGPWMKFNHNLQHALHRSLFEGVSTGKSTSVSVGTYWLGTEKSEEKKRENKFRQFLKSLLMNLFYLRGSGSRSNYTTRYSRVQELDYFTKRRTIFQIQGWRVYYKQHFLSWESLPLHVYGGKFPSVWKLIEQENRRLITG